MHRKFSKYILLLPSVLLIAILTTYPLLYALILSFYDWRMNLSDKPQQFVWLDNYIRAFLDKEFWETIWITFQYTVTSVVLSVVLGLTIALFLQKPGKIHSIIKTTLIFPYAISAALKGYTLKFMLNTDYGVISKALNAIFPFTVGVQWLGTPFMALFWLAMTEIWGWAPMIALMFLGALGSISPSIYEAARLDGVTNFELFRYITLPLLKPIILVVTLLKTIFSLKMFDAVVTMTGGGPGTSTQTLNYYVYQFAFKYLDMGYASAMACILVLIISVFVIFYVKSIGRSVYRR